MKKLLVLEDMQIYVSLGCSAEERLYKQKIELELELLFSDDYKACDNDNLEDTVCYSTLRKRIQKFCDGSQYNLIEFLANQIYKFIDKEYPFISVEYLKLIKTPSVSQIGKASFILRK